MSSFLLASTKPTLGAHAQLSVDQLLALLAPADDAALANTFNDVVANAPQAAEFRNDRRVVAQSILALTANKQNVKLLEQAVTLPKQHRAWLQNKAATATTDLLVKATRKRARDEARLQRSKQQQQQQQARARIDSGGSGGGSDDDAAAPREGSLRSAAFARSASQFSSFLVAVDLEEKQQQQHQSSTYPKTITAMSPEINLKEIDDSSSE